MKQIINGKKYDTKTAILLCGGLYKKLNGEYFYLDFSSITPFTLAEAKEYVEFNYNSQYEALFGEVSE